MWRIYIVQIYHQLPQMPGASLPPVPTHWLFDRADLAQTPSVLQKEDSASPIRAPSGTITQEQERILRGKGVHLIFKMGEFLQLPQHVLTTACVFFHRFFMRRPLQISRSGAGWSHYEIATACVFLACKAEEALRKLSIVVDAAMASLDKSPEGQARWADRSFRSNHGSHEFTKWRDLVLLHEETVLTTLCFDFVVPQPHEALVRATRLLHVEKPLARLAWSIITDTLRDPTCIIFDAPVLAAGAFKKACIVYGTDPAMFYGARPPNGPPVPPEEDYIDWLDAFDVDDEEAQSAFEAIEDVYAFHLPQQQQRGGHKPPPRQGPGDVSGEVGVTASVPPPPPPPVPPAALTRAVPPPASEPKEEGEISG